jgi:hypothetical protein
MKILLLSLEGSFIKISAISIFYHITRYYRSQLRLEM